MGTAIIKGRTEPYANVCADSMCCSADSYGVFECEIWAEETPIEYTIKIMKSGYYPYTTKLIVEDGKAYTIYATLEKIPPEEVTPEPTGVTVLPSVPLSDKASVTVSYDLKSCLGWGGTSVGSISLTGLRLIGGTKHYDIHLHENGEIDDLHIKGDRHGLYETYFIRDYCPSPGEWYVCNECTKERILTYNPFNYRRLYDDRGVYFEVYATFDEVLEGPDRHFWRRLGVFYQPIIFPADLVIGEIKVTPTELYVCEYATVIVPVTNKGDETGSKTISLKVNGVEVESRTITLEGRQSTAEYFTIHADYEGAYTIEVDGIVIENAFVATPVPATLMLSNLNIPKATVEEPVLITFVAENIGMLAGSWDLSLKVGGVEVDTIPITLEPGERKTIQSEYTFYITGNYVVEVDGLEGSVTVEPAPEEVPEEKPPYWLLLPAGLLLLLATKKEKEEKHGSKYR